jgi:hypothetical protein
LGRNLAGNGTSSIPKWLGRKIDTLRATTNAAGFQLRERLAAYPEYVSWIPDPLRQRALAWVDDSGLVRPDQEAR